MAFDIPKKGFTDINEDIDYFEKGLKCGLEIHQQLDTKKLFCNCDTVVHENTDYLKPDFVLNRRLNLTKSELGDIDIAAQQESKKFRLNQYYGFNDSSCLVDIDEEPPHEPNKEAIKIALEVAKFFSMKIFDKLCFMRKIVVDGSNTTGFQRTGLLAQNGMLEEKNVHIESLCLEEDACKKVRDYVSDNEMVSIYDLSRLGVPLVELATAPDIKTPNQAKEVAEYIGMVLRSTKKVKRGIGTIRQDVNVSIRNGVRTEIKGAQQLDLIPKLIIYEIMRQSNLIKIFNELHRRNALVNEPIELTELLKKSESKILKQNLENKGVIYGIKLVNFAGFLGLEIQPNKRFGTEIAGKIKVFGINGLFHSDELPKYGITKQEVDIINEKLECTSGDGFIIIAEQKEKVLNAMNMIKNYLSKLKLTKDVRQSLPDGTTAYLRPISGSARMYPETDISDVILDEKLLNSIPKIELLTSHFKKLNQKYGIRKSDANELIKLNIDIDNFINKYSNLDAKFIVEFLLDYPKEIKKRYDVEIDINLYAQEILDKLNLSFITKESAFEILKLKAQNKNVNYSDFEQLSMEEIKLNIKSVIRENPNAPKNALMGMCMAKLRGKADGKLVKKILDEFVQ